MLTLQSYYDLLVRSAFDGTFPSYDSSGKYDCVYRSSNGKRCAVGCAIPDTLYREEMEGMNASGLLKNYLCIRELFPIELTDGFEGWNCQLDKIQQAHDDESSDDEWNGERFVTKLNELDVFADVNKQVVVNRFTSNCE